ncbi:hypothetical protein ACJMK2_010605 [Sinanodonta woodiana]|uniref:RWD domain-containing protein n=1 Tax=Sinanodonta woodiana TaxID=1069815 RepID=A0ABD3VIB1_SINWO
MEHCCPFIYILALISQTWNTCPFIYILALIPQTWNTVHMPEEYPSHSPPQYQLNAPWLKGAERKNVEGALADIFCENIGESIIYLWVERIREFLRDKTDEHPHDPAKSISERVITQTAEVEEDDDLDVSSLEPMGTSVHSANSDEEWECPSITSSEPITEKRSTFQAHLAPVFHKKQVDMVIEKLYENKKIANATHNIVAYRIYQAGPDSKSPILIHGCDDDGETHAGSRMLHLLQILDVRNVMVVVSRWFGGILLGSDRFKHINNCTRSILEQCGYLKEKDDKKVLHTGDKKKSQSQACKPQGHIQIFCVARCEAIPNYMAEFTSTRDPDFGFVFEKLQQYIDRQFLYKLKQTRKVYDSHTKNLKRKEAEQKLQEFLHKPSDQFKVCFPGQILLVQPLPSSDSPQENSCYSKIPPQFDPLTRRLGRH